MITSRRICWPDPDTTCLAGGCGYCNAYDYRRVRDVWRYAYDTGTLAAFHYGRLRGWPNVDRRSR